MELDRYAIGRLPYHKRHKDIAYQAIRGREQQLIDHYGGAKSDNPNTNLRNVYRGVGRQLPRSVQRRYWSASNRRFRQQLAPFNDGRRPYKWRQYPKMYKDDKHASVAAFVLAALEFFQEVERDEKLASRYLELGLGPAVSWKGDIDLAISKGDLEGLKDIQEQFLEMAMLLSTVLLAELNERVKRASGVDFETYNAAFLGRVEEMLAQGTVGSAEDYRDLERYLFRLQGSEPPEQPSERQLAVERLMDAFDTFDVVEDETVIIKRGEEILARQTIRSPEEFAALDAYRNHLIDSQDTSGREWDVGELLGKHARFDKPF